MSTFARLAGLPVQIDSYELEGLRLQVSSAFERHTTLIRLRGGGEEGAGEDVTYDAPDQPPDPSLYQRVVEAFPEAWIEDPALTEETEPILEPHRDRITWDAPIHGIADIESLPFPPRMVNVKPSRLGGLRSLLDCYDYCDERGIGAYGGGQFELGVGRGHIQYLASLFHADAPNDVAPAGYNLPATPAGLPSSPLEPSPSRTGFRWGDAT